MSLLSMKENYNFLRREPNLDEVVQIANPKTVEFEVVRTTLIPGLLKTLQSNAGESLPQRLFEISDIVVIEPTQDVLAKNERRVCVMYLNTNASFEIV